MRRRTIIATALAGIASLALATTAPVAAMADQSDPVPGTAPTWLGTGTDLGAANPTASVTARIALAPRGGLAALHAAAMAVSTPDSPSAGHFLTPDQYRARFAPTDAAVQRVARWARSAGLQVGAVGPDNESVTVSGDVSVVQKALDLRLRRWRHHGQTVQAPAGAATLPRAVGADVLTISGLDTTRTLLKPRDLPSGLRNAPPCSPAYGQTVPTTGPDGTVLPKYHGKQLPAPVCGYVGRQLRGVYEGRTPLTGKGVEIAILGAYASPTIAADAMTYAAKHGDAPYAPGQLTESNPAFVQDDTCGDPTEFFREETLDVEAAHAMSGAAKLHYYGVATCEDSDFATTYRRILDENTASIVSTSYGDFGEDVGADVLLTDTLLFARGALQGVSFLFSSGDAGDESIDLGTTAADFPASDPFVTAVGGTSDAIDGRGSLVGRTGWGTGEATLSGSGWTEPAFLYGSGGGTSAVFPKPFYQFGTVGGSRRSVPDVGLTGDPTTGFLIGETQQFDDGARYDEYRLGGTSLSCPLFAGLTALALQSAGHRVGLLNPTIYRTKATAFQDVLPGFPDEGNVRTDFVNGKDAAAGYHYSVRTFGQDSSLPVTRGYDQVTGVGAPTPAWLTALR